MIPLFLEAVLLALVGFSAGMIVAYLVVFRRRHRSFWEE
jgi:hypothetical protein